MWLNPAICLQFSNTVVHFVFLKEVLEDANGNRLHEPLNLPCRNSLMAKLSSPTDADKLYAILFLAVTALNSSASHEYLDKAGILPRCRHGEANREADVFGSPVKAVGAASKASPARLHVVGGIDGLTKQEAEWTRASEAADLSIRSEASTGRGRPGVARLVPASSLSASFLADPMDAACSAPGGRNLSMITRDSDSEDSDDE